MWDGIPLGFQAPVGWNLHCSINIFSTDKYSENNVVSVAVYTNDQKKNKWKRRLHQRHTKIKGISYM